jgi:hypothetical protein
MTLRFEAILTEGVAHLSYLVGDDATGAAAIVDPRPDVEIYLERARRLGVAITHVFETHIHADFLSGARELAARLGDAELCVSVEGGASYDFPHRGIRDADVFTFGAVRLTPANSSTRVTCSPSAAATSPARSTSRCGRSFRSGPVGYSTPTGPFCWCWRTTAIWPRSRRCCGGPASPASRAI